MVLALLDRPAVRPACHSHPGTRIQLDGFAPCRWSGAHRRPRYRCVFPEGTPGHVFTLPIPVRQPTGAHPDAGAACPNCDHLFERHEGVRCGNGFVFGHQEIARLFIHIGEGMSLPRRELRAPRALPRQPGAPQRESGGRGAGAGRAPLVEPALALPRPLEVLVGRPAA